MPLPKHIGIIMDGNRRFAKRLMLKPWKGHEWGATKVEKIIEWCIEKKVKELTLYTLSVENFNSRPKEELEYLMKIFKENFAKLREDKQVNEKGIKVNFIGRLHMFDNELQGLMKDLMENTKHNSSFTVNFAVAYGGRTEVVDAVIKIAKQVKEGKLNIDQINEDVFADNLYIPNDLDFIIRTGGNIRTSNFLPYQSAYSEWFFIDKMFPEFEKEDFIRCYEQFSNRKRRFGK